MTDELLHWKNTQKFNVTVSPPIKNIPQTVTLEKHPHSDIIFYFKDGQKATFKDCESMQDLLDKMNKAHELEKENKVLQEKLDIAVNRFLVIKNQIELWKKGYYGKTEYCVEYYIEQTVDEALAKIKEIK